MQDPLFSEEDALFWDVLTKCERELTVRVPRYGNEELLMEQLKLLTVRAHRLMTRISESGDKRLDVERYEAELTRVQGRMLQCIVARIRLQMDARKLSLAENSAVEGKDPIVEALIGSLSVWDDPPEDA